MGKKSKRKLEGNGTANLLTYHFKNRAIWPSDTFGGENFEHRIAFRETCLPELKPNIPNLVFLLDKKKLYATVT